MKKHVVRQIRQTHCNLKENTITNCYFQQIICIVILQERNDVFSH